MFCPGLKVCALASLVDRLYASTNLMLLLYVLCPQQVMLVVALQAAACRSRARTVPPTAPHTPAPQATTT